MHPLREVALGVGLHAEEALAEIHHFPSEEEREPGHTGECCGAGTEDSVTVPRLRGVVVLGVAALCEVSIAPGEQY